MWFAQAPTAVRCVCRGFAFMYTLLTDSLGHRTPCLVPGGNGVYSRVAAFACRLASIDVSRLCHHCLLRFSSLSQTSRWLGRSIIDAQSVACWEWPVFAGRIMRTQFHRLSDSTNSI
uniref:Putative secreted protein n=1 Tax=Amblyomma cajennense TaxID=34607 RepID=A0A023FCH9_AMBCJ